MATKEDRYKLPEAVLSYLRRIGAEVLTFKSAMVKEYKGAYYIERSLIVFKEDGTVECNNKQHAPSKEEASAIAEALKGMEFPKHAPASEAGAKAFIENKGWKRGEYHLIRDRAAGRISMIQQRFYNDGGQKVFVSWSLWSDNVWRMMEPGGRLSFWKPREKRIQDRLMIHEGGKAAEYCDWLVNDKSIEAEEARSKHPWAEELARYEHWGMIGGALAPHRSNYKEIRREVPLEVVYVCDNDWQGRSVIKKFSHFYNESLKVIHFDSRFPDGFDLADPLPEKLFWHGRWTGPALGQLRRAATAATEMIPNPSGKGAPIAVLRDAFREEWHHSISPEVYIHKDWPNQILNANEFNSQVRPYADVDDVARLLRADAANKSRQLHYQPGAPSGLFGNNQIGQFFNTYCKSPIEPARKFKKSDAQPWLDFMELLIPGEIDRHEVLRWCATLVAKPEVKMLYGLLMISETQGVGKGTLGEKVLAPLVGMANVSFPSETDVVESQFNAWIAHKRLAIVHEIYAGASTKAYNKLKSVITDRYITVNKKHMSTYEIENWLHVFACSNSARALKLSIDDRRWYVPKVSEEKPEGGEAYWSKFNRWLEQEGGLEIIARWAIEWLLDNRGVRQGETAPDSEAKRAMIEESMSPGMVIAAGLLDDWKAANEGREVFCTDQMLVDHIRNVLYQGRHNDRLEKPATIRKLAKSRGWFVGELRTKVFSRDGTAARVIANRESLAKRHPDGLSAEGFEVLEIPV